MDDSKLISLIQTRRQALVNEWMGELLGKESSHVEEYDRDRLLGECEVFLERLGAAMESGASGKEAWADVERLISDVARSRAELGLSAIQTVRFVFSLKQVMFKAIARETGVAEFAPARERFDEIIERLAIHTFEVFSQSREALIRRQAEAILELSCPIIKIWEGALLCVIIGTVDSARAQDLLEAVLSAVRTMEARVVILDITGVSVMDTKVLQHLFTIVRGTRFMGAEVVITGVTPAIAGTVTKLHLDLSTFHAKSSLRMGLREAFHLLGVAVEGSTR